MNREMKFIKYGHGFCSGAYCYYDVLGEYPVPFIQFCNEILEDAANEKYDDPIHFEIAGDKISIHPYHDGYDIEKLKKSNIKLFKALEKATIISCKVNDWYARVYSMKVEDYPKFLSDYGIEVKTEEETKKQQEAPIVARLFGMELENK